MNFFDGVVIICNGKGEETERRALVKCKHCYAYEGGTCKGHKHGGIYREQRKKGEKSE